MKNISNTRRISKLLFITSCVAVTFAIAFFALFIRGGYPNKILTLFSNTHQETFQPVHNDKAIDAWENSLRQSHLDVDIVFFGDSITRRGHFDKLFPDQTICNLGLGSDTIVGMTDRVSMISAVSPETVFVMGGINSLRDNTLEATIDEYTTMLSNIADNCNSSVYVISVLPISKSKSETLGCSSKTITQFNESLQAISAKFDFPYIDLYSKFVDDNGFMNTNLTTDGVHLTDTAYKIWADTISPYTD